MRRTQGRGMVEADSAAGAESGWETGARLVRVPTCGARLPVKQGGREGERPYAGLAAAARPAHERAHGKVGKEREMGCGRGKAERAGPIGQKGRGREFSLFIFFSKFPKQF